MEPSAMDTSATMHRRHRFPPEIINHCVWLYFRFCLRYRDIEEPMLVRGVFVTYEAIRQWCQKFGQQYANQLRHWRPRPGDKWHFDESAPRTHSQSAGVWCCTGDEGGPLGAGLQEQSPIPDSAGNPSGAEEKVQDGAPWKVWQLRTKVWSGAYPYGQASRLVCSPCAIKTMISSGTGEVSA